MSTGLSPALSRTPIVAAIAFAMAAAPFPASAAVSARAGATEAAGVKVRPAQGDRTKVASRKAARAKANRIKAIEAAVATPPPPEPVRSDAANHIVAFVAAARDNGGLPYAIIDKQAASLLLFDAKGDFLGQTPVLLGIGVGDDSSPGVGAKNLSEIGPAERTTPAGRFVAKFGRAFGRERVLWVDYANSVALHAVITTHKAERRVARLLSPSPDDNRISFGCINVGSRFYTGKLRPLFQKKGGVVYILPDTRALYDVFPRARLLPYLGTTAASPEMPPETKAPL